jgi:hypothetical protein
MWIDETMKWLALDALLLELEESLEKDNEELDENLT